MTLELTLARTEKMVALLVVLAAACPLPAADGAKTAADPLAGAFFSPELVLLARDRIALTAEQHQALRDRMEKTRLRGDELRARLERDTTALALLAKQQHVDEAAIAAQLDKVLDVEREAKHLHLGLLAAVKNLLTPEQQAQLRNIEAASKRVTQKVDRVNQVAHTWENVGRDTSFIAKAMDEKVRPLVEASKVIEAEAELDRLLERLAPDGK